MTAPRNKILIGDCVKTMQSLPDCCVSMCVTSPPYYALRDYNVDGQIGLEDSPDAYIAKLVEVFHEVRRILRDDGTLWLNLGDSYANDMKWGGYSGGKNYTSAAGGCEGQRVRRGTDKDPKRGAAAEGQPMSRSSSGYRPKNLMGIPWRVAFALQDDGWELRQQMPWLKRNAMPESTRDRPTTAVEQIFLFAKRSRYFYDYEAVRRTMAESSGSRLAQDIDQQKGSERANGGAKTNGAMKAVGDKQRGHSRRHAGFNDRWDAMPKEEQCAQRAWRNTDLFYESLEYPHGAIMAGDEIVAFDTPTSAFKDSHFATFPWRLIKPCILAGCPEGGLVFDPFGGSGTTGQVAKALGRDYLLCELNPDYVTMAEKRIKSPLYDNSPKTLKSCAGQRDLFATPAVET